MSNSGPAAYQLCCCRLLHGLAGSGRYVPEKTPRHFLSLHTRTHTHIHTHAQTKTRTRTQDVHKQIWLYPDCEIQSMDNCPPTGHPVRPHSVSPCMHYLKTNKNSRHCAIVYVAYAESAKRVIVPLPAHCATTSSLWANNNAFRKVSWLCLEEWPCTASGSSLRLALLYCTSTPSCTNKHEPMFPQRRVCKVPLRL